MRNWRRLAPLLLLLFIVGCRKGDEKRNLRDTEGRTFSAECNAEGRCKLTQTGGPSDSSESGKPVIWAGGNLVGACNGDGAKPSAGSCRAIACKSDDDCPPQAQGAHGLCLNDLCREPTHEELTVDDAIMLCLAGTGPGRSQPRQVERFALALNCGNPCKIPAPCRQP